VTSRTGFCIDLATTTRRFASRKTPQTARGFNIRDNTFDNAIFAVSQLVAAL